MHLSSQNVNLSMLQDPQPFWLGVFFMYINIFDHIFQPIALLARMLIIFFNMDIL